MKKILYLLFIIFILGCIKKEPVDIKNLTITLNPIQQSNDTLILDWSNVASPLLKSYLVIKTGLGGWSPVMSSTQGVTKFLDTHFIPETDYSYAIQAILSTGDTLTSNVQIIKTDPIKVELAPLKTYNDSVVLDWKINYSKELAVSTIYRTIENEDWIELKKIYSTSNKTYTDKDVPHTTNVKYQVSAQLNTRPTIAVSNEQAFTRNEIKFTKIPAFDTQYDNEKKLLYFFGKNGEIQIFDLTTDKFTSFIQSDVPIGYCDIGVHNGQKELYVPRSDGWIFVYDAFTLTKKDQIMVGSGIDVTSLVYHNGIIIVNTNAISGNLLRSYSRSNKSSISQSPSGGNWRIVKIPGSNIELVEVTPWSTALPFSYYQLDNTGKILITLKDVQTQTSGVTGKIFEMFPTGEKFISSITGYIFNKNLKQVGALQNIGREFTSFFIDDKTNEIYAGTTAKTIEVFSSNTYQHIRSISPKYYPFKIFKTEDKLISVGTFYRRGSYETPTQLFIESVKL